MDYSKEALERIRNFAESKRGTSCDKCSLPVPPGNNALVFDFINSVGTDWILAATGVSRHLEPVAGDGGILICEGSSSRWQHIHGIKDQRQEYDNGKFPDPTAVAIWNLMQTLDSKKFEAE